MTSIAHGETVSEFGFQMRLSARLCLEVTETDLRSLRAERDWFEIKFKFTHGGRGFDKV